MDNVHDDYLLLLISYILFYVTVFAYFTVVFYCDSYIYWFDFSLFEFHDVISWSGVFLRQSTCSVSDVALSDDTFPCLGNQLGR